MQVFEVGGWQHAKTIGIRYLNYCEFGTPYSIDLRADHRRRFRSNVGALTAYELMAAEHLNAEQMPDSYDRLARLHDKYGQTYAEHMNSRPYLSCDRKPVSKFKRTLKMQVMFWLEFMIEFQPERPVDSIEIDCGEPFGGAPVPKKRRPNGWRNCVRL